MRFLRVVFILVVVALATVAGVFIAAIAALAGVVFFLVQSFRRRGPRTPVPPGARPRPRPPQAADAIDVVATEVEVPPDSLPR